LPKGGSKIVFYGDNTKISKSVAGAFSDLEIGAEISASGKANDDGSITAEAIQLRLSAPAVQ
jgi:hypothetical protein